MDNINRFLCFSSAAGIPVSLFENGRNIAGKESPFPDFALNMLEKLPAHGDGIIYTIVLDFLFLGTVRVGNKEAVIGPVASYKCSYKMAQRLLLIMSQNTRRTSELLQYFREKPICSLNRFCDALRFVGMLYDANAEQEIMFLPFEKSDTKFIEIKDTNLTPWDEVDNIKEVEDKIYLYVETGDTAAMEDFLDSITDNSAAGLLDDDALRSIKNTFIMSISVVTRAAIRGGLDYNTAMWVQGTYLFAVEGMHSYQEVNNNIRRMFLDFTSRVAETRIFPDASQTVKRACRYVNANIREKISTADLANALGYDRSYLCRIFKEQTGLTIADFILQAKISSVKKLILYTDKSLAEIADEMGFSSQNYFQASFKKCTGETPGSYRIREKR